MFLFDPNIYARNPGGAATTVQEIVEKNGGTLRASRLWNEQKLAYPINGHRKGVYWLTYIEIESTSIPQLNRACQLKDLIMRHLVIKLEPRLVEPMIAAATGTASTGESAAADDAAKTDDSEKESSSDANSDAETVAN